jgi:hypothetical protein
MEQKDNIELRSEKVRNIIGQIPPKIIRIGITVAFLIFSMLLVGAYFFQFEYTINANSTLYQNSNAINYSVKVASNEYSKIKTKQKIIFNTEGINHSTIQNITAEVQLIDSTLYFSDNFSYSLIKGSLYYPNLVIVDTMELPATIYVAKTNVINWLLNKVE